jgi:hypothetical protein
MRHWKSSVAAQAIISATRDYAMMAVVTKYGSGNQNPASNPQDLLPGAEINGKLTQLVSTVEIANGDSANSVLKFGKVHSSVRINRDSKIDHDAITGVNDFDLGVAGNIDKLVNGADITAAGNKSAVSAVNIDSLHKPLWEILGLASDPDTEQEIIGTLKANATAAGTVTLTLVYTQPNAC